MPITVEALVDMYVSDAYKFISTDSTIYQTQRDLAIELSVNSLGYASTASLPTSGSDPSIGANWRKYAALTACLEIVTVLRFNLLNKPINKELEQGTKAEFEARSKLIDSLEKSLRVQVEDVAATLELKDAVVLPPMFSEARVDYTKNYDAEGYEIDE